MSKKILLVIASLLIFMCVDVRAENAKYNCVYKTADDSKKVLPDFTLMITLDEKNQMTVQSSLGETWIFRNFGISNPCSQNAWVRVTNGYVGTDSAGKIFADISAGSTSPKSSNGEVLGNLVLARTYWTDFSGNIISGSNNGNKPSNGSSFKDWTNGIDWDTDACPAIFGSANEPGDLFYVLKHYIFTPIRIITPILLVLLTSIDFAKAVFGDSVDAMKKAKGNFTKRAIAAVILFLAPTIVSIILGLIDRSIVGNCLDINGIENL